jgi:hypothetical protein
MKKTTEEYIKQVARDVVLLLLEKNKNYGDTANNPLHIFSKLNAREGLCARIDDKLSRIKTLGINKCSDIASSEDTIKDLIGYLILLKVQIEKENDKIRKRIIQKKDEVKFGQ